MTIIFSRICKHTCATITAMLLCSNIIIGQARAGATVETEAGPTLSQLKGTVMAVTEEGFMLVSTTDQYDDVIRVRQWAFRADPEALAMVVLGRGLSCDILYDTGEYLSADCVVWFFDDRRDAPLFNDTSSIFEIGSIGLGVLIAMQGLAIFKCDEIDLEYLPPVSKFNTYRESCE